MPPSLDGDWGKISVQGKKWGYRALSGGRDLLTSRHEGYDDPDPPGNPETRQVFAALGMGCLDCLGAKVETVETAGSHARA